MMRVVFVFIILILLPSCRRIQEPVPAQSGDTLLRGVDVSLLPAIRKAGGLWYTGNYQPGDMLHAMHRAGVNLIRLRVWNRDSSGLHAPVAVAAVCAEARALGIKTLLSIHYSDTWADPAHQALPAAWKNLDLQTLGDSISQFTAHVLGQSKPDYVQIGNEINGGFLWPAGKADDTGTFHGLLRKAISAARQASQHTKIVLHYAGLDGAEWFFRQRATIDYDIAALSYYPLWHGTDTGAFALGLASLQKSTGKRLILAETAYPFTLGWKDQTHNVLGLESQCVPAYGASPGGQLAFMQMIDRTVRNTPGVLGYCYWGGEWVAMPGIPGSSWENQALWDFDLRPLPVWKVFAEIEVAGSDQ
jgi:arabinogalactan endo-1,4-beta-galactosidase